MVTVSFLGGSHSSEALGVATFWGYRQFFLTDAWHLSFRHAWHGKKKIKNIEFTCFECTCLKLFSVRDSNASCCLVASYTVIWFFCIGPSLRSHWLFVILFQYGFACVCDRLGACFVEWPRMHGCCAPVFGHCWPSVGRTLFPQCWCLHRCCNSSQEIS